MNALALYAYEENLASLFTLGLTALGLTAPNVNSLPQFQKARPRVEVFLHGFSAHTPVQLTLLADNLRRITAYRGNLVLTCVTACDAGGKLSHSSYRAQVRAAMDLGVISAAINQAAQVSGTASTTIPANKVCTFTTTAPHGFTSGQLVTVESTQLFLATQGAVITVTSPTTFTYLGNLGNGSDNQATAALVVPYAVQWAIPSASTLTTRYNEGYESSKLTYQVEFSMQKNAWSFLTAE